MKMFCRVDSDSCDRCKDKSSNPEADWVNDDVPLDFHFRLCKDCHALLAAREGVDAGIEINRLLWEVQA